MTQSAVTKPLLSLTQLHTLCQQQIAHFIRHQEGDSAHCLEIVCRAAEGDHHALGLLLEEITGPIVAKKHGGNHPFTKEDLQQAVFERLIKKFYHETSPYKPSTFAAYHSYVNLTIRSVINNWYRQNPTAATSEQFNDAIQTIHAIRDCQPERELQKRERQHIAMQVLDLISDDLAREAVLLRVCFDESYENILMTLKRREPNLTIADLYRLVEKGKRQIQSHPDLSHLFEMLDR